MPRKYRGWFGRNAKRHCPHSTLQGIFGDGVVACGGWRLFCEDCGSYLAGPVELARYRRTERNDFAVKSYTK